MFRRNSKWRRGMVQVQSRRNYYVEDVKRICCWCLRGNENKVVQRVGWWILWDAEYWNVTK